MTCGFVIDKLSVSRHSRPSTTMTTHQPLLTISTPLILLEEKLDLTLFCVRRSQNFISHRSLIFNVCPKRDTGASSTKVTRHLLLYTLSSWWAGGFGLPVLCANRTFPKVAPRGKRTHDACLEGLVISLAYRERVFIFILGFYMMLYDA